MGCVLPVKTQTFVSVAECQVIIVFMFVCQPYLSFHCTVVIHILSIVLAGVFHNKDISLSNIGYPEVQFIQEREDKCLIIFVFSS